MNPMEVCGVCLIFSFGGGGGNRTPVRERPLLGPSPGSACVWPLACSDPTGRVSAGQPCEVSDRAYRAVSPVLSRVSYALPKPTGKLRRTSLR